MIKWSVQQEQRTTQNKYTPNNIKAPKYTQQVLKDLNGEEGSNTTIPGDTNTPLSGKNGSYKQKINKETAS